MMTVVGVDFDDGFLVAALFETELDYWVACTMHGGCFDKLQT